MKKCRVTKAYGHLRVGQILELTKMQRQAWKHCIEVIEQQAAAVDVPAAILVPEMLPALKAKRAYKKRTIV